jgi:hypothetical protein
MAAISIATNFNHGRMIHLVCWREQAITQVIGIAPGAPGLATFETRVRTDPSLWEGRQIQKLQFLHIP